MALQTKMPLNVDIQQPKFNEHKAVTLINGINSCSSLRKTLDQLGYYLPGLDEMEERLKKDLVDNGLI